MMKHPEVFLEMYNFPKEKTHRLTLLDKFQEIMENTHDNTKVYMDASKSGDKIACAAVNPKITKKKCLQKGSSIFTVEAYVVSCRHHH